VHASPTTARHTALCETVDFVAVETFVAVVDFFTGPAAGRFASWRRTNFRAVMHLPAGVLRFDVVVEMVVAATHVGASLHGAFAEAPQLGSIAALVPMSPVPIPGADTFAALGTALLLARMRHFAKMEAVRL